MPPDTAPSVPRHADPPVWKSYKTRTDCLLPNPDTSSATDNSSPDPLRKRRQVLWSHQLLRLDNADQTRGKRCSGEQHSVWRSVLCSACAPRGMARGTDSGRGVLEPHRLLRPRQAVWCFCSRSTPFTLAVASTFVRTLSGEHRIRGSRSMRFAGTHGFNLAGGRRVVQKKRTRSPDRKTAHAGPPDARQADGATTYGHLLAP